MSNITEDGMYQDASDVSVDLSIGDLRIKSVVRVKQLNSLFFAFDANNGPWQGRGQTVENAVLNYLIQRTAKGE